MTMDIAILGGGAVGLTLAARMARAGQAVHVITRRPEAAQALAQGLTAEDAATNTSFTVQISAGTTIPTGLPILCCTRGDTLDQAVEAIAACDPATPTVTFQNDVLFEEQAAKRLSHVIGGVWRETCTALDDARVRFQIHRPSRVILGQYPNGFSELIGKLVESFTMANIDVGVSSHILEDKWLKLCVNLTSAPNALVRRSDHTTEAFSEIKVRLLEEARTVLNAAGIVARSCDGKDRSLDDEIEYHRGSVSAGTSARPLPLYNQVWCSLQRGTPLEADGYYERIRVLAQQQGIDVPTNCHVQFALRNAYAQKRGPECLAAADLLP